MCLPASAIASSGVRSAALATMYAEYQSDQWCAAGATASYAPWCSSASRSNSASVVVADQLGAGRFDVVDVGDGNDNDFQLEIHGIQPDAAGRRTTQGESLVFCYGRRTPRS